MFVFSSKITFFGLIIAQLALVFVLSGMVQRLSAGMATTLFMLYSALTGLTLSSIFIAYTYSSIASTFVVTGGMFGGMCPSGYTTKRGLSGLRRPHKQHAAEAAQIALRGVTIQAHRPKHPAGDHKGAGDR